MVHERKKQNKVNYATVLEAFVSRRKRALLGHIILWFLKTYISR